MFNSCQRKLPVLTYMIGINYDKCWTILKIKDNSGGVYCGCIKVLRMSSRTGALPGHIVTVLLKKAYLKNIL